MAIEILRSKRGQAVTQNDGFSAPMTATRRGPPIQDDESAARSTHAEWSIAKAVYRTTATTSQRR